ncbi:MAG: chlorophyll a/b-binding protein [Phormidesmis sp.]
MTNSSSEQAIAENSPSPDSSPPNSEATGTPQHAENPSFGWNQYAERVNGRFAMIGFVALLLTEIITRQDFFTWLGLR